MQLIYYPTFKDSDDFIRLLDSAKNEIKEMQKKGQIYDCLDAIYVFEGFLNHSFKHTTSALEEDNIRQHKGYLIPDYIDKNFRVSYNFIIPREKLWDTYQKIEKFDDEISEIEGIVFSEYQFLISDKHTNLVLNLNLNNIFDPVSEYVLGIGTFAIDYGSKFEFAGFQIEYNEKKDSFSLYLGDPKIAHKNSDSSQLKSLYNSLNVVLLYPTKYCSDAKTLFSIGANGYTDIYGYLVKTDSDFRLYRE